MRFVGLGRFRVVALLSAGILSLSPEAGWAQEEKGEFPRPRERVVDGEKNTKEQKSETERPTPKPPAAVPPNSVEVRLVEGSILSGVMLQETLEVETKFGKLTVPTLSTRKIQFGPRLSAELRARIDAAMAKLASDSFDRREEGTRELIEIGAPAYPKLREAIEDSDIEVVQRATVAMRKIRERSVGSRLPATLDDKLETTKFPIVGSVVNPTVRIRCYFGEVDLKVTDLAEVRWLSANTVQEVTVDASKYGDGNSWMETNIIVEPEMGLIIRASGQVNLNVNGGGEFVTGPTGNNNWGRRGPHPPGALLGKFGKDGTVFVIGEKYTSMESTGGKLYLQIAPSPWNQSQGSYKVTVRSGRNIVGDE